MLNELNELSQKRFKKDFPNLLKEEEKIILELFGKPAVLPLEYKKHSIPSLLKVYGYKYPPTNLDYTLWSNKNGKYFSNLNWLIIDNDIASKFRDKMFDETVKREYKSQLKNDQSDVLLENIEHYYEKYRNEEPADDVLPDFDSIIPNLDGYEPVKKINIVLDLDYSNKIKRHVMLNNRVFVKLDYFLFMTKTLKTTIYIKIQNSRYSPVAFVQNGTLKGLVMNIDYKTKIEV